MPKTQIGAYDFKQVEEFVLKYWNANKIYNLAVSKNKKKRQFYFLDGPPYTTGDIHIGHAWNKALKDCFVRYKRMAGFDVNDTPGFDMHGLPIEVQVEKKLGIKNKQEILTKLGLKRFIGECEKFATENMTPMIKDFKRIGVWMDWENPYMTIKNSYIEGAWWALKRADENGFLYEGEKAMTWCPRCATALAKHELEYETVADDSIFVKFPVAGKKNEFLIIWTTTPWTIPYNLAVMANPEIDYIKASVNNEIWILAKALSSSVINAVAGKQFKVLEEFKGIKLEGIRYEHPFREEIKIFDEIQKKHPKTHTVVISKEYVDISSGSGLVHCAPGCGPEDYEVGRRNNLPPFNEIDEHGVFSEKMGKFKGLVAKSDDDVFVKELDKKGLLIAKTKVQHEYAHCWRCKNPVVYKTTKQWFLAVEKLKEQMLSENKKIKWVPEWAGSRWFSSWLSDLQDWCISRQRFWGIPLPIWKCGKCGNIRLIESNAELKKLTGKELKNLHRPWIDEVKIRCEKCKSEMSRIEDVLDVWLDSGAAPWSIVSRLKYDEVVADFILEGKDQIRGWFNSLMCLSMVARKKNIYKAVYMHGMIMDALGRKMSKSLKNIISPYEVIEKYGADTMRYYMIGAANPGLDMNYNFDDMKVKFKNLQVLWNVHKFLIDFASANDFDGVPKKVEFGIEEHYMISRLNSTIKKTTLLFESYALNEIPIEVESLFLELSRSYLQMIREKSALGTEEEKKAILFAVANTLFETLKLFAPVAPFITEQIYLNLKNLLKSKEKSIHLFDFPSHDEKKINIELEKEMEIAKDVIQAILFAREKAQLGVRWPVKSVSIATKNAEAKKAIEKLINLIKAQTNVKDIYMQETWMKKKVKADYSKLGPVFGEKAAKIIAHLAMHSPETILGAIEKQGKFVLKVDKESYDIIKDYLIITREVPSHLIETEFKGGFIYLNKERTKELDAEGFAREITRRTQQARKEAGLQKKNKINLFVKTDKELKEMLKPWLAQIKEKVGAIKIEVNTATSESYEFSAKEKVKDKEIEIMFDKAN